MAWARGDRVITPRGDLARVVSVSGLFLALVYIEPIEGCDPELTLHEKLVRRYEHGHAVPKPAVVGDPLEVAVRRATLRRSRW